MYLAIQVACFDAIFDCITSMIGGLFNLHIVKSTPNNQKWKNRGFVGSNNFSAQFIKIISHYKKIGYNINVLQQTACLVVNPITVGNFSFLFNCTPVGRTSDSMMVPT